VTDAIAESAPAERSPEVAAQVAEHFAELDRIKAALAEVPQLYTRRVELYQLLRAAEPPVPYADIAAHTDAGPEAVRVAVNKANREASGNPVSRKTKRRA
jgi:hypothetical protein